MATHVYSWTDSTRAVSILIGNKLYDPSGRTIIACTDERGGLYAGPNADGVQDYVIVGDQVRVFSADGAAVFTIRGNKICDGIDSMPTFNCEGYPSDARLALALTAIAYAGALHLRPGGANVVPSISYNGMDKRKRYDDNLDYNQVYPNSGNIFAKKTIPSDLANKFETPERSPNYMSDIQRNRQPPSLKKTESPFFSPAFIEMAEKQKQEVDEWKREREQRSIENEAYDEAWRRRMLGKDLPPPPPLTPEEEENMRWERIKIRKQGEKERKERERIENTPSFRFRKRISDIFYEILEVICYVICFAIKVTLLFLTGMVIYFTYWMISGMLGF